MKMQFPQRSFNRFPLAQSHCESNALLEESSQIKSKISLRNSTNSQGTYSSCQRQSNKINYKYQRVNNTFKLVEVNSTEDNKQNFPREDSDKKILFLIQSLNERVEKLQTNQKIPQPKENTNFDELIEKALTQHYQKIEARNNFLERNLEERIKQIEKIKHSLTEFKFQQQRSIDIELRVVKNQSKQEIRRFLNGKATDLINIVKNFESRLQQQIKLVMRRVRNEQLQKITDKVCEKPLISFQYRQQIIFNEETRWSHERVYKIDEYGYLLDDLNQYLIDKRGNLIKVHECHLKKMKEFQMLVEQ